MLQIRNLILQQMLTTADFLNICVGLGFLFLVGAVSYAFYNLALLLKSLREVIETVNSVRDVIKFGALSLIKNIFKGKEGS